MTDVEAGTRRRHSRWSDDSDEDNDDRGRRGTKRDARGHADQHQRGSKRARLSPRDDREDAAHPPRRRNPTEDVDNGCDGFGTGARQRGDGDGDDGAEAAVVKEQINYVPSGALAAPAAGGASAAAAAGTGAAGTNLAQRYSEPPDAAMPEQRWRLYVFKGDEQVATLHLHRASFYLLGRNRDLIDIPLDHPSCSGVHAVLQYRRVRLQDGEAVRLYLMDFGSTNGTQLNAEKLRRMRYYQLLEKDVIRFGESTREYVVLHDNSDASGKSTTSV